MALETASARVLVVWLAVVESSCIAIPHLDADTGLDLRGTGKGEGIHGTSLVADTEMSIRGRQKVQDESARPCHMSPVSRNALS